MKTWRDYRIATIAASFYSDGSAGLLLLIDYPCKLVVAARVLTAEEDLIPVATPCPLDWQVGAKPPTASRQAK